MNYCYKKISELQQFFLVYLKLNLVYLSLYKIMLLNLFIYFTMIYIIFIVGFPKGKDFFVKFKKNQSESYIKFFIIFNYENSNGY